eukprot:6214028-Alexandrium_andersonii.AAC.1
MTAALRNGAPEGSGELRRAPRSSGELQGARGNPGEPLGNWLKSPLVIGWGITRSQDHTIAS